MTDFDELDNALLTKPHKDSSRPAQLGDTNKKRVAFKESVGYDLDDDFKDSDEEEDLRPQMKSDRFADLFGLRPNTVKEIKETVSLTEPKVSIANNEDTLPKNAITPSATVFSGRRQSQDTALRESDFLGPSTNRTETLKSNQSAQKNTKKRPLFDDEDDLAIPNLPEKSTVSMRDPGKKSSLMEEIFGNRPKSSPTLDRRQSSFTDGTVTRSNTGESVTASGFTTNESSSRASVTTGFSLSVPKESRRGRRTSTAPLDPLGLLSALDDSSKDEIKQIHPPPIVSDSTSKTADLDDLPEWLGGPKTNRNEKSSEPEKVTRSDLSSSAKSIEATAKTSGSTIPATTTTTTTHSSDEITGLTSKLLGMEFDQQATIMGMQQQEHELRTAAALSQQSEKLNKLLESQRLRLSEQEGHFNALISRQLERQALLEAQIKARQERIDSYIQTLSAVPTTLPSMPLELSKEVKVDSNEAEDSAVESEAEIQKLQLEKLYLENTLDSLREKHEKEISIIDDSYKKQITYLEEAMVQMEKRMQDDVECLDADYRLKIQKLKDEMIEMEKAHKAEKDLLKEEHVKVVREIREQSSRSLELLQSEHEEVIAKIIKSKETEREAIEIMRIDGTNIENVLNKSQSIVESLDCLQKKFDARDNNFIDSQDHHLKAQEQNIEYLKQQLEKQREESAGEKQKLMTTIQKLEIDISELMSEFRKQNASFKESEQILKSRELAILRDRELLVEQSNWERERLQAMRDSWAKEHDKEMEWLVQERQALAAEKGKLQIFNRLKIGYDESSKEELEATVRAAQDAIAKANQEKLKWKEKINELESQRNSLEEKESGLVRKAKELQEFTQSAVAKREEGLKALKEAHFIEERYKEKMKLLQKQEELLLEKESKLAAEKLELSRQRLAFHVSDIEKPEKDISTARTRIGIAEDMSLSEVLSESRRYTPLSMTKNIVDPHLVLLKWDLHNKLGSSKIPTTVQPSH
ncbi:hypothetical protein QAD02_006156 [Eretmocerus hayati]|uniref:Uncharacterized protein n=1 Tax=Eretmocerus hayati TaxID=131215 RepID=A0ACC2N065_9HYME|nr:hypothetical protein QAD02_006156 [Eretmocerus hayati]